MIDRPAPPRPALPVLLRVREHVHGAVPRGRAVRRARALRAHRAHLARLPPDAAPRRSVIHPATVNVSTPETSVVVPIPELKKSDVDTYIVWVG